MFVRVMVYPDAKREEFKTTGRGRFIISVKEPATQNRANTKVRELVASHARVPVTQVKMISGHHQNRKIFSLPDDVDT